MVQNARCGGIGIGRQARLYAAFEQQHASSVTHRRARAGAGSAARQLGLERCGQYRVNAAPQLHQVAEGCRPRRQLPQAAAQRALQRRAGHGLINHGTADVQQVVVINARRAGGLAVAAGQAAIEVQLGLGRGRVAFQHLLDQVDAPTRAIEFVAEQLIGRTGGIAEPTVHAGAQDALGFLGTGQAFGGLAQGGLHGSDLRVHPSGVEDSLWIKALLELLVVMQ
ncbi:hypothetical protein D3C77_458420 [compost metagenome]